MKIKVAISIITAFVLISCSNKAYLFTSFHEPADAGLRMLYSYDGFKWKDFNTVFLKPEVGTQKVMRDPSMVLGPDGSFHLVWTSSWQKDKGFGTASSKDLIHWTPQKHVPVMEHEPGAVNVWAPEVFYDDVKQYYIIVWATTIPGRFERGVEPDSNNHRLYATTTKDFNSFTPAQLYLDPKFSVIDAQIVKRKTNDYVLILKDNTRPQRNVKVAFGTSAMGPWYNISEPFTENFTEGPNAVKLKNEWLIYFDSYRKKTYEAVSTKDFIHFENADKRIHIPQNHKHGTIVPVKKKIIRQLLKEVRKNNL